MGAELDVAEVPMEPIVERVGDRPAEGDTEPAGAGSDAGVELDVAEVPVEFIV